MSSGVCLLAVDVGPQIDQQLHHRSVAQSSGMEESRAVFAVPQLKVGAILGDKVGTGDWLFVLHGLTLAPSSSSSRSVSRWPEQAACIRGVQPPRFGASTSLLHGEVKLSKLKAEPD
ncbi:hypothetical protein HPB52_022179 [Rhipicephalus sanguineus]|uniref:Uncharacterized protein n=1 Tax=Rhipicephalus sanguineus TaxID=34632 RepID=A0A9D4PSX5_RHISA|nr:hypothetical protein HPB52_022179 [Rhipicephalus sanguineus]